MMPTARQLEILKLVADGMIDKQIADVLGISWQTVRNHLYMLYARSGALNRPHAVAMAFRKGWFSVGEQIRAGQPESQQTT